MNSEEKITTYVCVDLETTGLNPKEDRIIEIGAVYVENDEIKGEFQTFVNPGVKLPERITELTSIIDEDLKDAPPIDEVWPAFLKFCRGAETLVGHAIIFDYSFLKKAAVNRKETYERQGVDTLKIARRYLPELPHRSLGYLAEYYGIPHNAHRALEDARATVQLYNHLWTDFCAKDEAEGVFLPAPLIFKVKRDVPITPAQKERLNVLIARHHITDAPEIDTMTRSQASRYTDRLLATFGR